MDINGNFLVMATSVGSIRMYDISRAEPKQVCDTTVVTLL
jgi:hypothetical protein